MGGQVDGCEVGESGEGEEGVARAGGEGHLAVGDEERGEERGDGEGEEEAAVLPVEEVAGLEGGGAGTGVEEAVK